MYNLKKVIGLAETSHLVAPNTAIANKSEPTFHHTNGMSHGNDLAIMPQSWLDRVLRMALQRRLGKDVQLAQDRVENLAHAPVPFTLEYARYVASG